MLMLMLRVNLEDIAQDLMNQMASAPESVFALTVQETKNLTGLLYYIVGKVCVCVAYECTCHHFAVYVNIRSADANILSSIRLSIFL